jgi:hypothetical protein
VDLIETPSTTREPGPLVVALALAALGIGQAVALTRDLPLPAEVMLTVPLEGYAFTTESDTAVVGFQLRNDGVRELRVGEVGAAVPGLQLVDVTAAGEATGFRSVGDGSTALPEFVLAPDGTVVVQLRFRAEDCSSVPADLRPVSVEVRASRGLGTLQVALPPLPDDGALARPDDQLPWQQVLIRDLCR